MVNMASAGVTYMPSRTRCSVMTPPWGALIGTMDLGVMLFSMPMTSMPGTL